MLMLRRILVFAFSVLLAGIAGCGAFLGILVFSRGEGVPIPRFVVLLDDRKHALVAEVHNLGSIHSRYHLRLVVQTCDGSSHVIGIAYITPHKRLNIYKRDNASYLVAGGEVGLHVFLDRLRIEQKRGTLIEKVANDFPGPEPHGIGPPKIEALQCGATTSTCVTSLFLDACFVGAIDMLESRGRHYWSFYSHAERAEEHPHARRLEGGVRGSPNGPPASR